MRIHVIRHAPREPSDGFSEAEEGDPEADLTPEGEEIAKSLGDWMANNDAIPSVIYHSPTVRAQQTAEHIAEAIGDAGFATPDLVQDASIGPYQSILPLVKKLAADGSKDAAIVSHHESIRNGLKALSVDNNEDAKVDPHAAGELRTYKVKRKSGRWKEKSRVRPSALGQGFSDTY